MPAFFGVTGQLRRKVNIIEDWISELIETGERLAI
jgi:hypothetical protein